MSRAAVGVALEALALEPFQPVLGRYARRALQSGTASATAQVQYSSENEAPRVNATGALEVTALRLDEEQSGDRFLSWKSLSARNTRFSSAPARLAIEEVQVVEPGAKLVVSENRRVNIAQVMRDRTADAASARGGPTEAAGAPFAVDVARVTLRGGTVDFADLSLVLPFSTTVRSFDGSVIGVSTDRAKRAEVKAAGIIANQGAARMSGSIRPFAPTQYSNLRAEFENATGTHLRDRIGDELLAQAEEAGEREDGVMHATVVQVEHQSWISPGFSPSGLRAAMPISWLMR
jgi:hypothetical protein